MPRGYARAVADRMAASCGLGSDRTADPGTVADDRRVDSRRGGRAAARLAAARRGRDCERFSHGRACVAGAAHSGRLRSLRAAARAAPPALRRLPVVLPDDDADDSRGRRLDGTVSRQAHHRARAAARDGRQGNRGRPSGLSRRSRNGERRRVRIAGRGVQQHGERSGEEPQAPRALDGRSRAQAPRGGRAPPLHRDDSRADCHRRRVDRRGGKNQHAQQRGDAAAGVERVCSGTAGGRCICARGSPAVRRAAAHRGDGQDRAFDAGDSADARRSRAAAGGGRDGAPRHGRIRRHGAGRRRLVAADSRAESGGVDAGRAPSRT